MQEKGIQTTPGCTTVEHNGEVHEFIADDDAHPRKMEIYDKLNEINRHLRIAGYVPNVSSELHDLDSEGKEKCPHLSQWKAGNCFCSPCDAAAHTNTT